MAMAGGWNRTPYDQQDLARMQADAARRVREMQQRANGMVAQTNRAGETAPLRPLEPMPQPKPPTLPLPPDPQQDPVPTVPNMPAIAHLARREQERATAAEPEKKKGVWASLATLMETVGLEQDHLILLLLLFLLVTSEESDRTLLLALFYLLL